LFLGHAPADAFQTVRVYKRGGAIMLMVDDIVALAWEDDGKLPSPSPAHRCEYGHVKINRLHR